MTEEEIIRNQFTSILNNLVNNKIAPTGTAILSAQQPMILLFEKLIYKINRQDKEINKLNNVIKWKPIEEYNRKKYDWVLVKYFDGDYECVPEVAEQRSDGKWYTSEKQIPFEVKYFFDMQILDEKKKGRI